jgi:hypothetical protein
VHDPDSNYGPERATSHKPHQRTIFIGYGRSVATCFSLSADIQGVTVTCTSTGRSPNSNQSGAERRDYDEQYIVSMEAADKTRSLHLTHISAIFNRIILVKYQDVSQAGSASVIRRH